MLLVEYTIQSEYRYSYPYVLKRPAITSTCCFSINTAILLTSSLSMALAVYAAARGSRQQLVYFLLAAIILGVIFLGIKFVEYSREFSEHLFPGGDFNFQGINPKRAKIFFSLYFTLTGMHAVHMIIGTLMIAGLTYFSWRGRFTQESYAPVEMIGLYWHFVDIVWIFIFPLMYLVGPK